MESKKETIRFETTVQLSVLSPISTPIPQLAVRSEKAFKDFRETSISALRAQQSKWPRSVSSPWLMGRLAVILITSLSEKDRERRTCFQDFCVFSVHTVDGRCL